jgi:predicted Fe-Mo cluster-binding NifX family protein
MKIAIPTEDGFTINEHFMPAKGFLLTTIELGEIIRQEMRWNSHGDIHTTEDESYINLADSAIVIVRGIDYIQSNYLKLHKKEVIISKEKMITNVLMHYLQTSLQKESNTCCCP